jgi:YfiH family protein
LILKKNDGVPFFQFAKLARFTDIHHGIFTRNSGESRGFYKSLNVSYGVGDDRRSVRKNREIISKCMGAEDFVFVDQVHGMRVLTYANGDQEDEVVTFEDSSADSLAMLPEGQHFVPESDSGRKRIADAIVTNIRKKFLVVQVADCQSVLLYDPVRKIVANVHSGWRGSVTNIIGRTIQAMKSKFGCRSRDLVAGIGPSLGPCCAQFINYKKEIPASYWRYKDNNEHFDFWSMSRDQMCDAGVLAENVEVSRACTKCDTNIFFSFRGEGTTGRFASVIGLR